MARAFVCHEPMLFSVNFRSYFYQHDPPVLCHSFTVAAELIAEIDLSCLCFVYKGKCYAARTKSFYSSGRMAVVTCIDFSEELAGKKMILKDFLLGS